jgi:hypothetical protein
VIFQEMGGLLKYVNNCEHNSNIEGTTNKFELNHSAAQQNEEILSDDNNSLIKKHPEYSAADSSAKSKLHDISWDLFK